MLQPFTAWDASQLGEAWAHEYLVGEGWLLTAQQVAKAYEAALVDFAEYRDRFKTWDGWLGCLTEHAQKQIEG